MPEQYYFSFLTVVRMEVDYAGLFKSILDSLQVRVLSHDKSGKG